VDASGIRPRQSSSVSLEETPDRTVMTLVQGNARNTSGSAKMNAYRSVTNVRENVCQKTLFLVVIIVI